MEAKLLKGKEIALKLQVEMQNEIGQLRQKGIIPKIVALSIGDDQASQLYLKSQRRLADKIGIEHEIIECDNHISEEEFIRNIENLNNDKNVNGIIIQMPLPEHISIGHIYATIDPLKDVEGIHADNLGLLVLKKGKLSPCTALAAMELVEASGVSLYGTDVVIVGAGKVVGRPLSLLMMDKMATITVCNIGTSEKGLLEGHVRRADILVVAAGKAGLIPGDWVKEGAVVVDVGINHIDGKVVGDVDFDNAKKRASYITPVPGGVGPLTCTILMRNVLTALKLQLSAD